MQAVFALVSELGIIFRHFATNVNVMLIYGNITDRQTDGKTYQWYSSEPK